jgi:hypothetical protein
VQKTSLGESCTGILESWILSFFKLQLSRNCRKFRPRFYCGFERSECCKIWKRSYSYIKSHKVSFCRLVTVNRSKKWDGRVKVLSCRTRQSFLMLYALSNSLNTEVSSRPVCIWTLKRQLILMYCLLIWRLSFNYRNQIRWKKWIGENIGRICRGLFKCTIPVFGFRETKTYLRVFPVNLLVFSFKFIAWLGHQHVPF